VVRGVNVVPLKPNDKRPAIDWKPLQAGRLIERDWDWLDRWLMSWWRSHGVGALTGEVSGIVVVDVDDDGARDLVERTCGWPETVTVRTSKGWHLWFAHPGGRLPNRARVGDVGLDVRADGGFVVCPPSVHPSGHVYVWERSPWDFSDGMWPPAEMSPELIALLWPPVSVPRPTVTGSPTSDRYAAAALAREADAVRSSSVGTRNDTLNRAAYSVARFIPVTLSARSAADVLVAAAAAAGLSDTEARRTIASAFSSRGAA
jgi:putative DNA primase/helicase